VAANEVFVKLKPALFEVTTVSGAAPEFAKAPLYVQPLTLNAWPPLVSVRFAV
jgi:hypothetical protein